MWYIALLPISYNKGIIPALPWKACLYMNLVPDADLNKHEEVRLRAKGVDRYIGCRIRQLRLSMGLTQSDLGERVDISSNQIHKIETGVSEISVGRLYLIACALDVSIDYLFDSQGQEIAQTTNSRRIRQFRHEINRIADLGDLDVTGQIIRILRVVQRPI